MRRKELVARGLAIIMAMSLAPASAFAAEPAFSEEVFSEEAGSAEAQTGAFDEDGFGEADGAGGVEDESLAGSSETTQDAFDGVGDGFDGTNVGAVEEADEAGDAAPAGEDAEAARDSEDDTDVAAGQYVDEEQVSELEDVSSGEAAGQEAVPSDETAGQESENTTGNPAATQAAEEDAAEGDVAEETAGTPAAFEEVPGSTPEGGAAVEKAMSSASVGGVTYFYVDTEGDADDTVYTYSITTGRGANAVTTNYSRTKSELSQAAGTSVYYICADNATPLTGTLYGYGAGTATNYRQVYGPMGVNVDADAAYDAVTSATGFTGFHAKDIPSLATFGTTAGGEKAITGLELNRAAKTVDAAAYVEAGILKAAGNDLTPEQEAVLATALKANPMSAPADKEIQVKLSSATFTTSRYGKAEFAVVPDDTVEGYVWSEYWSNVYAATISDGSATAGAVHWIDLYGESATSGPHYNKVEIALNDGESLGSNGAQVSRYADFFDNGFIKAGTYEINIYAEGYTTLTAQVRVGAALANRTATYNGKPVVVDAVKLDGIEGEAAYTYYRDKACSQPLSSAPVDAGTYYAKAVVADLVASNVATVKINPAASTVTLKAKTAVYNGKTINIGKAAVKGSSGKVTYTYYTDAKCTKKAAKHVNAGTYYVKAAVAAKGNYKAAASKAVKLTISKAAQKVTASVSSKTFTAKEVKAGAKTFSIGAKASGKGKLTYKKDSGSKYLTVNAKDGKITVKKGTPKGNYSVKVTIKAAKNTNYKAASLTKTVKVTVK